jgi:HAD superfamily hydrolase (TIGR01549 family)
MKPTKLIVFDFDGVLADTYELYQEFLMKKFRLTERRAKQFLDNSAVSLRKQKNFIWLTRQMEAYYYRSFKKYIQNRQDLYRSEVPELLDILNIPVGVVTRSTVEVCKEILATQFDRFEFVYGRKHFQHKHEIIHKIIKKRGLEVEEVLFITDTTADIVDVLEILPLSQIFVTSWGFSSVADLKLHIPDNQILKTSLLEIVKVISEPTSQSPTPNSISQKAQETFDALSH